MTDREQTFCSSRDAIITAREAAEQTLDGTLPYEETWHTLATEVLRLHTALEQIRDWPKIGEHRQVLSVSHGLLADYIRDILESK